MVKGLTSASKRTAKVTQGAPCLLAASHSVRVFVGGARPDPVPSDDLAPGRSERARASACLLAQSSAQLSSRSHTAQVFVLWTGHAGIVLSMNGVVVYCDPFYEMKHLLSKHTVLDFEAANLPAPDVIVLSHAHLDHTRQGALPLFLRADGPAGGFSWRCAGLSPGDLDKLVARARQRRPAGPPVQIYAGTRMRKHLHKMMEAPKGDYVVHEVLGTVVACRLLSCTSRARPAHMGWLRRASRWHGVAPRRPGTRVMISCGRRALRLLMCRCRSLPHPISTGRCRRLSSPSARCGEIRRAAAVRCRERHLRRPRCSFVIRGLRRDAGGKRHVANGHDAPR